MTLYPLAFPKGVKYLCEICRETAYLQCQFCYVTYYCCNEHQEKDWRAIHKIICPRLKYLRRPPPSFMYKEERLSREAELHEKKLNLIELTNQIARKELYDGEEELAMPAAMQSLNLSMMVHGAHSLHLIPCYVMLAEGCIGQSKLDQAREYLVQASWNVLKNPHAPPALRSILHRTQGRLAAASDDTDEALREFAEDIYQSSLAFGPDDVHTSGGYFYMAEVFFNQGKRMVADSLFRQVCQSWYNHLHRIFKYTTRTHPVPRGVGPGVIEDDEPVVKGLDEIQKSEARTFLTAMFELRRKQRRCPHREMMIVCLTLGILYFLLHNRDEARELGRKAVALGRRDPDSPDSHKAIHFLTVCETYE